MTLGEEEECCEEEEEQEGGEEEKRECTGRERAMTEKEEAGKGRTK